MSKLLGLLVFDNLNDVVYIRCNLKFIHHLQNLAINQGLLEKQSRSNYAKKEDSATESQSDEHDNFGNVQESLDPNVVIQLFSPLVTSQRIMKGQFKSSYSSIECEDGTTLLFREHSGYLFLCIGTYPELYLQRFTNIAVRMVQLIVGHCVSLLKTDKEKCKTLDNLLNAWIELYSKEQSFLVEAIERLIVSPETSATAVRTLSSIVHSVTKRKGIRSGHAMFFVRNRLLTLYSSKNADELMESDVMALILLSRSIAFRDSNFSCLKTTTRTEEPLNSPSPEAFGGEGDSWLVEDDDYEALSIEAETDEEEEEEDDFDDVRLRDPEEGISLSSFVLLLESKNSSLSPHLVHVTSITNELTLVVAAEINRSQLSSQLLEAFDILEDLRNEECNFRDVPVIEVVDNALRNAQDFLRWIPKVDYPKVKRNLFQVCNRWEVLKKNELEEWLKSPPGSELPSRTEANISSLLNSLRMAWNVACLDISVPTVSKVVEAAALRAKASSMSELVAALEPEPWRNTSLGSCSIISISKYLEEFPGLIHFLYIDRSTHQLTAPMLWTTQKKESGGGGGGIEVSETAAGPIRRLTTAKIWSMVDFAREHLSRGHMSAIWKDKTFSYSYFLWFEDQSGNPLKPVVVEKDPFEDQPQPGILCGDFYKTFAAKAFPDCPVHRLRGFELFCVHLGTVTSPCILEQTRRLAATVWEIAGPTSTNPMDLL